MKYIQDIYVVGFMLLCIVGVVCISNTGAMQPSDTEPKSDFIWINNNRVHVDSLITTRPIFNASGEQEGLWIKVTYQGSDVFIECVDELGYTWEEWSESWLMAFKEETE